MNTIKKDREISVKELWQIFAQRWWLMLLAAIICASGLFIFKKVTFVPRYSSTATLYLLRQEASSDERTTSLVQDFSIGLNVVNDCNHLLKSHAVVEETIKELDLDMTYEGLVGSISTYSPEESRVLEVTVVADTPENAKRIVDRLCEVGQEKITEALGFEQIRLFEYGVLDKNPSNRTGMKTYAACGLVAALLVYLFFLLLSFVDDKIYSEEEIETALGLPILGTIPNVNEEKKRRYGYYSEYGKKETPEKKEAR